MKTFEQLLNENNTISEKIKALDEYFSTMKFTEHEELKAGKITVAEFKAKTEQRRKEEVEKSRELDKLKIAQKILKDNIRQAYYAETMPKVLEVMKKYEGKPMGEKTKDKLRAELRDMGIHFFISKEAYYTSDEIHISPVDHPYIFNHDDMTVYVHNSGGTIGGEKRPILGGDGGNRLIVYSLDAYYLYYCGEYIDDYMFHADRILYRYKQLLDKRNEIEKEYQSFNELLPSSMNRLSIGDYLYSRIA